MSNSKDNKKTIPTILIVWVVITVLLIISSIFGATTSPSTLIILAPLIIATIMVLSGSGGKGGRVFIIIYNFLFAALLIFTTLSISSPSASQCVSSRFRSGICDLTTQERIQYDTIIKTTGCVLSIYFLSSGVLFASSKNVKDRFIKK